MPEKAGNLDKHVTTLTNNQQNAARLE